MRTDTYNTRQKQLIYELLKNNSEAQFTCEDISDLLKKEGTPVGKTTVYRYLDKLCADGTVRKFSDTKSATFQFVNADLRCDDHMHLKCTSCGKFIHLGCEFMNSVGKHIMEHHSFTIDNSKTVILGVCEKCSSENG